MDTAERLLKELQTLLNRQEEEITKLQAEAFDWRIRAEAAEHRAQREGWVNLPKVPNDPMLWALCSAADVCKRCVAGMYKAQDGVPWTCGNYLHAAKDYQAVLSAAPNEQEEKP